MQCRRPSVGRLFELDDVRCGQLETGAVEQQLRRLADIETQCCGIYFNQLVVHAHSAQRETEAGAAGDDQVQVVAAVLEQERQCRPCVLVAHTVPVVDDQGDVVIRGMEIVDQRGQNVPFAAGAVDFEFTDQLSADGWLCDGDGLDQVREEPDEGVVVVVDRQPRSRHPLLPQGREALSGECALTEPRGCMNEHQAPAPAAAQAFEQLRARHRRPWCVTGGRYLVDALGGAG